MIDGSYWARINDGAFNQLQFGEVPNDQGDGCTALYNHVLEVVVQDLSIVDWCLFTDEF